MTEGDAAGTAPAKACKTSAKPEAPANDPPLARYHARIVEMWAKACPTNVHAGLTTAMKAYASRLSAS